MSSPATLGSCESLACLSFKVKQDEVLLDAVTFTEDGLSDDSGIKWSHSNDIPRNSSPKSISLAFTELVDPVLAACFIADLRRSKTVFSHLARKLLRFLSGHRQQDENVNQMFHVKLTVHLKQQSSLQSMECDIKWSNRILPLWTNQLVMEDIFSWLSTLGGAYSSLGDYYSDCAVQAGRLSVKQLRLAWMLGDPFLQSRCMVFLAQSLMQRRYFKLARKLIRRQYQFALVAKPYDHRLAAMCEGVWTRIQYAHWKRRVDRGLNVTLKTGTLSGEFKASERHMDGNGHCLDRGICTESHR